MRFVFSSPAPPLFLLTNPLFPPFRTKTNVQSTTNTAKKVSKPVSEAAADLLPALEWEGGSTLSPVRAEEDSLEEGGRRSRSVECPEEEGDEGEGSSLVTRTISFRRFSGRWEVGWEGWEGWAAEEEGRGERAEEEREEIRLRGWEGWAVEEWEEEEDSLEGLGWTSIRTKISTRRARRGRRRLRRLVRRLFLSPLSSSFPFSLDEQVADAFLSTPAVKQLPISLEDLYKGCTKKLKVTKKKLNGTEESNTLESTSPFLSALARKRPRTDSPFPSSSSSILTVAVKPGWKAGTKVRFAKAGHETPAGAQDMVFVIGEKDHPTFKRDGDDLIYTVKIPLVDALAGPPGGGSPSKTLTHLDGRTVSYNVPYPRGGGNPIKPGQVVKVVGEVRLSSSSFLPVPHRTDFSAVSICRACPSPARTPLDQKATSSSNSTSSSPTGSRRRRRRE